MLAAKRVSDKKITVTWRGENEINLDKYILERSTNGQNFTTIGSRDPLANNGGSAGYHYDDYDPLTNDNFYRVKSIGLDGRVHYSNIVKVGPSAVISSITVNPNPVKDKILNIHFVNQPFGIYKIYLSNKLGQQVYSINIKIDNNNIHQSIKPGASLAAGSYLLNIYSENGTPTVLQIVIE